MSGETTAAERSTVIDYVWEKIKKEGTDRVSLQQCVEKSVPLLGRNKKSMSKNLRRKLYGKLYAEFKHFDNYKKAVLLWVIHVKAPPKFRQEMGNLIGVDGDGYLTYVHIPGHDFLDRKEEVVEIKQKKPKQVSDDKKPTTTRTPVNTPVQSVSAGSTEATDSKQDSQALHPSITGIDKESQTVEYDEVPERKPGRDLSVEGSPILFDYTQSSSETKQKSQKSEVTNINVAPVQPTNNLEYTEVFSVSITPSIENQTAKNNDEILQRKSGKGSVFTCYLGEWDSEMMKDVRLHQVARDLYDLYTSIGGPSDDSVSRFASRLLMSRSFDRKVPPMKFVLCIQTFVMSVLSLAEDPQMGRDVVPVKKLLESLERFTKSFGFKMNPEVAEDIESRMRKEEGNPTFVRIDDLGKRITQGMCSFQ